MAGENNKLDSRPVKDSHGELLAPEPMKPAMPIPFLPTGHKVVCIDEFEERASAGGIILAGNTESRANCGKLVAAGLAALDVLTSHGIYVGDKVMWGHYAPVYEEWVIPPERPGDRPKTVKLWVMSVNDIIGSYSAAERMHSNKIKYRAGRAADGRVQHYIEYVEF